MIDIIVAGYPKSGTTWVTRLVAELVGCPVVGFLDSDHYEIAQEGLDRKSSFQCFKSHHQFHEVRDIGTNEKRLIYVIRDPRDICLSGARFFRFDRFPRMSRFLRSLPLGKRIVTAIRAKSPETPEHRVQQMTEAILFGAGPAHFFLNTTWRGHYKPYVENECLLVRYEDLLHQAEHECKRILSHLSIDRSEQHVRVAIKRQSFQKRKNDFLKTGDMRRANFMKEGKKEQWRELLSEEQRDVFNRMLAEDLARFGYPLNRRGFTTDPGYSLMAFLCGVL